MNFRKNSYIFHDFRDTERMEFMRRWAWSLSEDAQILSEYREVRGLCGQGRWR